MEGGPRVAGTESGTLAVGWVSRELEDLGLETQAQDFECPLWRVREGPRLSIEKTGELACAVMIGSGSDEVSGLVEYRGCTLIWGDKIWPCFRVVDKVGRIRAYILVRPDGEAAGQPLPLGASDVPYLVVGCRDGREVERAALERRRVTLSVSTTTEPARGRNVRAWAEEDALSRGGVVLVTAHVDTVPDTPGAYDNAGGVAALIRVAERVAEGHLPSRVQLLLTDAEELHLTGSRAFVSRLEKEGQLDNVSGCLNLDGAGRGSVLDVWVDPESLEEHVLPLLGEQRARFTFPPPLSGDHTAFLERDVPSMMLTFDDPEIIHRAEDIYEPGKLNNALRMADIATDVLQRLTQKEVW